jgi:hypothetical protein
MPEQICVPRLIVADSDPYTAEPCVLECAAELASRIDTDERMGIDARTLDVAEGTSPSHSSFVEPL